MRKSHDQRRAEIIQGALEVAADQGIGRATTAAIAARVGIAQPTIFRHFDDRDAIFRAALESVGAGMRAELEPVFADTATPPARRLRAVLHRQLGYVAANKGIPRLLFSDRLHLESPALKEAVRDNMRLFHGGIAAILREGAGGDFPADTDPERAAWLVVSLVQGTVLRWSLMDFAFDLPAQADDLWALACQGLGGPGEPSNDTGGQP
jgi:AcrR family transcriptional regulator